MNYVDLLIGVILVGASLKGYRKGIFASLVKIASYGLGIGVSIYFYGSISSWLDRNFDLVHKVASLIYNLIPLPTTVMNTNIQTLNTWELTEVFATLPLPNFYRQQMISYIDNQQIILTGSIISIGETIAVILANTLVELFAFAVLLFIAVSIFKRLGALLSFATNQSPIGGVNRVAGAFLGVASGVITLMILFGIAVPIVALGQIAGIPVFHQIGEHVNSSQTMPFFLSLFALLQASAGGIVPFASGLLHKF